MISMPERDSLVVSPLRAPRPFFPFLYCMVLKGIFQQSLHSVARGAIQGNDLAARGTNHLGPDCTLGGNTHLEDLMDGLPETVEVVVYQAYEVRRTQKVPLLGNPHLIQVVTEICSMEKKLPRKLNKIIIK